MNYSTIFVYAFVVGYRRDVCRDWLMCLFVVGKLGEIDIEPNNKRTAFHSVLFTFCVKILSSPNFFPV